MILRIFYPYSLQRGRLITLDEANSHHIFGVLRLNVGDPLQIFNGEGGAYSAILHSRQKKLAVLEIKEFLPIERESPLHIHLGQAISRGERMDFTVQKSVELGINRITPLFTQRCGVSFNASRAENRVQHWQKIAISASEQCGRCRVPLVDSPQSLESFLAEATGLKFICSVFETPPLLPSLDKPVANVTLLIGPEGGFSPQEIHQAQLAGFYPLSLGPRILRTETAAIVALTLLQSRCGDIRSENFA